MWNEDVPIMRLARKIFKKYDREHTTRQNYYTWGFGIAKVFEEGLKRAGRDLTLDKLRAGLESLKQYKDSPYAPLTFTSTNHKGSSTLNVVKADVKTKRFISLGWRDPLELQ